MQTNRFTAVAMAVAPLLLLATNGSPGGGDAPDSPSAGDGGPEFYAIELTPTEQVSGTGGVSGEARVDFGTSPFGVAVTDDGSYRYRATVRAEGLPDREGKEFVAWVASSDLAERRRVGSLGGDGQAVGTVEWNKFMVVVTLEPEGSDDQERWSGPVVLRGLSRSGLMHSDAGHGPFQEQICMALAFEGCRSVR